MPGETQPFFAGLEETDFEHTRIIHLVHSKQDEDAHVDIADKEHIQCHDCVWSNDGKYLLGACGQKVVRVVPVHSLKYNTDLHGNEVLLIDLHQIVTAVSFASCAAAVSANKKSSHRKDVLTGYRSFHWENHNLIMAIGLKNGRTRILDSKTGRLLLELIDHTDAITKVCFAPDNSLMMLSSSIDGTVKCWDLKDDGNMTFTFKVSLHLHPGPKPKVNYIAWSQDSRRFAAVGSFKTVLVFDLHERRCLQKLNGHLAAGTCCDFSPDGVLLASCSGDTTTIVWNSLTGHMICILGHQFPPPSQWFSTDTDTKVIGCKFSKSGLQLTTVADDDFVRFWDITKPNQPAYLCKVTNPVSCCYNNDDSLLSVGTGTGSIAIIEPPPLKLSLLQMCRLKTNETLNGQISQVDRLPIPKELKDFLAYQVLEL